MKINLHEGRRTLKMLGGLLITLMLVSLKLEAQSEKLNSAQELSRLMASTFSADTSSAEVAVEAKAEENDNKVNAKMQDRRVAIASESLKGTWIYYQVNTGADNKLYRQRVIKLEPIDQNTVRQVLYTPKDLQAWENVWDKPAVISGASSEDFEASLNKGCEQIWTRTEANQWRGYVDPKKCKIFSERRGKEILIEGESILSLSSLKHAERGLSLDGQPLWGSAPGEFKTLLRQHSSSSSVIEFSEPEDWRRPDPGNLVLMKLSAGDVWIELAPQFAPLHVENIRALIAENYFDNTDIIRSQDNYVVQWGDANADTEKAKNFGKAKPKLPVEFFRDINSLPNFTKLDSRDAYADQVGLVDGFPVAGDQAKLWLAHCYGMLGVGRGMESDSGNGSSLYVVTGHAPRHLDRNVTLVGRVLSGMHHLSSLPRGTGPLGFYEEADQYIRVESMQLGAEFAARLDDEANAFFPYEIMRTDTPTFQKYVELRTTRNEDWFLEPTGRIGLCNVAVPSRSSKQ